MSKLIYVDKLKKDILALRDCYNGFSDTYNKACIIGVIEEQPTIEERKTGKWIYTPTEPLGYICSECKKGCCRYNFCPNCGSYNGGVNSMRLIDADALLDEVMERYCADCDKRKGIKDGKYRIIYEIGDAPCRACGVDDMISELEDAQPVVPDTNVGKWIPCSERYPDMDERVLVYTVAHDYHVWDCMSNRADNYFWEDEDGLYRDKYEVDLWMPLPEPI